MIRSLFNVFLIAVAGCAGNPTQEIAPDLESAAAERSQASQHGDLMALPVDGAAISEQRGGGFAALLGEQPQAPGQSFRHQYEAITARPESESRALELYLGSQAFNFIEDGEVILSGPIASGKAGSPTPTGRFSILSKDKDKESSLYTNEVGTQAWMPYAMQFHGNYFIHEGWLPGYPASHGCIRMDHNHAKLLFERMRIGDPVTVTN